MSVNYKSIAQKLKFEGRAFINGKYVNAIDGKKFETINPATGEKLCTVAKCNKKDVDLAVKVSRKAFNSGVWSRSSPEHRKEILLKFAELLRKHGNENSVLECVDTGKLILDCINEVANDAPMHFQWYGELIDKVFGKVGPTEPSITSLIVKEPIGVVAGIVPWNFPLMMAVWKMAPALAAGCSVIIKPAEDTPLTAIRVAKIAQEAGIPDGVLNVLPGYGDVGEALGRHKDVDAVSFTGSTEVGGYFLKYSSESNLKPVALEMGGKSPFIVLEDAKINDDLIDKLPIPDLLENGGIVAIWCTNSQRHLDAIECWLQKWNLVKKAKWYWLKITKYGQPITDWTHPHKKPYEQIIIATAKNDLEIENHYVFFSIPSIIHSHKPPIFPLLQKQGLISPERHHEEKFLEIFGRYLLPNCTTYGNQCLLFQDTIFNCK